MIDAGGDEGDGFEGDVPNESRRQSEHDGLTPRTRLKRWKTVVAVTYAHGMYS